MYLYLGNYSIVCVQKKSELHRDVLVSSTLDPNIVGTKERKFSHRNGDLVRVNGIFDISELRDIWGKITV